MRSGELEALTWCDGDEPRGRWRIATSKTGRPRWAGPPSLLRDAVLELCPRDDRHPDRRIFEHATSKRLHTALARACTAAASGLLATRFSPRRVSLLHLGGMPWARIGELVGHDDLVTTARTYTPPSLTSASSTMPSCFLGEPPSGRRRGAHGAARALEALVDVTRGQKPSSELERDIAELRERVRAASCVA